jgi:GNAT superfamily N-acetyltransferase
MAGEPPRDIDSFWSGFFGVDARALSEPGVVVVPHAALAGYAGLWFFVRGEACIVSAPPEWCGPVAQALREQGLDSLLCEDGLRALFGDAFERTVGPAFHAWLAPEAFRLYRAPSLPGIEVRELGAADAPAVAALRAAAGEEAWEHANLRTAEPGAFGCFEADALLAAASARSWGPGVVGPGVLTHPGHRRAGCGTAVVSAVVGRALARRELVVYQTLMENDAARGIARRLGFAFYATHLAVRLLPDLGSGADRRGRRPG